MRKKKKPSKYVWCSIGVFFLLMALLYALEASEGCLAISAHFGIKQEKTQRETQICTQVEILPGRSGSGRGGFKLKSFNFHLSNGEVYRLPSNELEKAGITDEKLRAIEGSAVTVEYVESRFLHSYYPLLSLEVGEETVIPKEITLWRWNTSWEATVFAFAAFGGIGVIVILSNCIYVYVASKRKQARLRRKKLRRQQQLERKAQNSKAKNNE